MSFTESYIAPFQTNVNNTQQIAQNLKISMFDHQSLILSCLFFIFSIFPRMFGLLSIIMMAKQLSKTK